MAKIRTQARNVNALLAAGIVLMVVCSARSQDVPVGSPKPASGAPLVIQGRITTIHGALVSVKTPNAYPGGPGIHPQFVIAGPTFKVDISRARVMLPDGSGIDSTPLAVGDRVLMVLRAPDSSPLASAQRSWESRPDVFREHR